MQQAVFKPHKEKINVLALLSQIVRTVLFGACVIFTFILLAALLSYHPNDPAWSSATQTETIHNLLGLKGALFADLALASLGKAAWLLPLFFIIYTYHLVYQARVFRLDAITLLRRLIGMLLVLFFAAALFDITNDSNEVVYRGGAIGSTIGQITVKAFIWLEIFLNQGNAKIVMAYFSQAFLAGLIVLSLMLASGYSPLYWVDYVGGKVLVVWSFSLAKLGRLKRGPQLKSVEHLMQKDQGFKVKDNGPQPPLDLDILADDQEPLLKVSKEKIDNEKVGYKKASEEKNSQKKNKKAESTIDTLPPSLEEPIPQRLPSIGQADYPIPDYPTQDEKSSDTVFAGEETLPTIMRNPRHTGRKSTILEEKETTRRVLEMSRWVNQPNFADNHKGKNEPSFSYEGSAPVAHGIDSIGDIDEVSKVEETEGAAKFSHYDDYLNAPSTEAFVDYFIQGDHEQDNRASANITPNITPTSTTSANEITYKEPTFSFNSEEASLYPTETPFSSEAINTTPTLDYPEDPEVIFLDDDLAPNLSSSFLATPPPTKTSEEILSPDNLPSDTSPTSPNLVTKESLEQPETVTTGDEFKPPQEPISTANASLYRGFEIDPRSGAPIIVEKAKDYPMVGQLPTSDLLGDPPPHQTFYDQDALYEMAGLIEAQLKNFNIGVHVAHIEPGPVITCFELDLSPGVKVSQISNLERDIARILSVPRVRVVDNIPGKSYIGLEIPNKNRQIVYFKDGLDSDIYKEANHPLTLILGKNTSGDHVIANLGKMPHLLVAGTTGSGKSVGINTMLLSLLYKATPDQLRLILIDPKMLELSVYNDIPHLLSPVITDMNESANALRWCVAEMERRYLLMSQLKVRNIAGYNHKVNEAIKAGKPIVDPVWQRANVVSDTVAPPTLKPLPFIVIVIDEFADMMMLVGKKCEELIARLAQKARASGIHLILATQRPSVDVITGLIKANIPSRIAFQVSSKIDSRTILDQQGAETLLGNGDMLYFPPGAPQPTRVHGAFVNDGEVNRIVDFLKLTGPPDYIEDILQEPTEPIPGLSEEAAGVANPENEKDPLFDEAVKIVVESNRASISYVQRRLRVGYQRAARMIEEMEELGYISEDLGNGNRDILIKAYHDNSE